MVVMFVVRVPVAVVDRDDRVIVTVVEVFRGRRLVVVAVAISDAHETTGVCRIANPAVARKLRIGACVTNAPSGYDDAELYER